MNAIQREQYVNGAKAYQDGLPDVNPWGISDLIKMTAWSAGYYDAKRGMI